MSVHPPDEFGTYVYRDRILQTELVIPAFPAESKLCVYTHLRTLNFAVFSENQKRVKLHASVFLHQGWVTPTPSRCKRKHIVI
jgi:hypothetical protein